MLIEYCLNIFIKKILNYWLVVDLSKQLLSFKELNKIPISTQKILSFISALGQLLTNKE